MYELLLSYIGGAVGIFLAVALFAGPRTLSEWGFVVVVSVFWPIAAIVVVVGIASGDI